MNLDLTAAIRRARVVVSILAAMVWTAPAWAHHDAQHVPDAVRGVDFEQRLQAQIPLDLVFRDETGRRLPLHHYFTDKPVILTLVYYDCPNLCTLVLNGLVRTLRAVPLTVGKDFNVVTVSIDPDNTPALAAAKKAQYVRDYGVPAAADGWHFLTGEADAIQRLAQAVGFQYTYDAQNDQFAHASGIMVLTPQGVLSQYYYGIDYVARDVRLGLVQAAANRMGSPIDQLLLFCYHYDPQSGQYTLALMKVLRVAGLTTVLALGMFMGVMFRRDRRKARPTERRE
jgi:protein SCO1/2